jgi:hypothetical protein
MPGCVRQQVTTRHGQVDVVEVTAVRMLQASRFRIRQQLFPGSFGITQHQRVKVRRGIVRTQSGVIAAGDNELAASMKLRGDLIGPRRQGSHKGNTDNVAVGAKIERFDVFIDNANMVLTWG